LKTLRFWNFPETAWRAMNYRQVTHTLACVLGSWKRNRLAAHSRPPGDAKRLAISGFADAAPGGTGWTARRRGVI